MQMYNDEFDQYHRTGAGDQDGGDAVLRAALEARKQQNIDSNGGGGVAVTPISIRNGTASRGGSAAGAGTGAEKVLNGGVLLIGNGNGSVSSSRNSNTNGSQSLGNQMNITEEPQSQMTSSSQIGVFDNRGFEMQATEI